MTISKLEVEVFGELGFFAGGTRKLKRQGNFFDSRVRTADVFGTRTHVNVVAHKAIFARNFQRLAGYPLGDPLTVVT